MSSTPRRAAAQAWPLQLHAWTTESAEPAQEASQLSDHEDHAVALLHTNQADMRQGGIIEATDGLADQSPWTAPHTQLGQRAIVAAAASRPAQALPWIQHQIRIHAGRASSRRRPRWLRVKRSRVRFASICFPAHPPLVFVVLAPKRRRRFALSHALQQSRSPGPHTVLDRNQLELSPSKQRCWACAT